MWKTLLYTWIPLGLHLDQSKYLDCVWNHSADNSICVFSSFLITRLIRNRDIYNLIFIYNRVMLITHDYKFSLVLQNLQQSKIDIFDWSHCIWLESTISRTNSSKILCCKTLLTVIVFKITFGGALFSNFCSLLQTSLSMQIVMKLGVWLVKCFVVSKVTCLSCGLSSTSLFPQNELASGSICVCQSLCCLYV